MKLCKLTGVAMMIAVVVASAAPASGEGQPVLPNDRAGMLGVGAIGDAGGTQPVRPDDRAGLGGIGRAEAVTAPSGRPDGRLLPDSVDLENSSRPTLVLVARDGFDWGDATIGAFGALGLTLLAIGLGAATWRTRASGDTQAAV